VAASIFAFARSNSRWIAAYPSARDAAESPPMDLTLDRSNAGPDRATVTSRPIARLASDLAITVTYRGRSVSPATKAHVSAARFIPSGSRERTESARERRSVSKIKSSNRAPPGWQGGGTAAGDFPFRRDRCSNSFRERAPDT